MPRLRFPKAEKHDYRLVGTGCIALADAAFSVGTDNIVGGYAFKIIGYDSEQRELTLDDNTVMGCFGVGMDVYIAPTQVGDVNTQQFKIVAIDDETQKIIIDDDLDGNPDISPESPASGMAGYLRGATAFSSGYRTIAVGKYSLATGNQTVALRASQSAHGRFNLPDTHGADGADEGFYVSIWGNGAEGNRSNAAAITWDGHIISGATAEPENDMLWPDSFALFDDNGTMKFKRKAANGSVNTITIGSDEHTHDGVYADLVEGKVPADQLPSYVDDVLEYASIAEFPAEGESGKIYVDLNTNKSYRWTGTTYIDIVGGVSLGETSATAYRGDRGKTAYDHSQAAHAPSDAQKNSDITKAEIEAKLTGELTSHSHASGGGGITDAPSNGNTYARKNAAWVDISGYLSDATSYGNPGGCGSRNAFVVVTASPGLVAQGNITGIIDGVVNPYAPQGSPVFTSEDISGKDIIFEFESALLITEMKFWQNTSGNNGTWQCYGSVAGSSYDVVGGTFTLGDGTALGVAQTITTTSANTTRYKYWKLHCVSGTGSGNYQMELEFKISR